MKFPRTVMIALFALSAATAWADEPKSYRITLSGANIGATALAGGQYTLLLHRDGAEPKVQLTDIRTGSVIDAAAKIENAETKFARTEVHSRDVNGVKQISEIRIGGTNLRVAFPATSNP